MSNQSINQKIKIYYSIVVAVFAVIIIAIPLKAGYISIVQGDDLRQKGDSAAMTRANVPITAPRGNIYSSDLQLMATTEYYYRLYIDFWADGVNGDTLRNNIDALATGLSKMFPERSTAHYKSYIMKGWDIRKKEESLIRSGNKNVKRTREYRLFDSNRLINYAQLKAIKTLPYLSKNKNKSGLIERRMVQRTKPFGTLASRTIGDIYGDFEKGGKNGVELAYDSLLRGIPGSGTYRKVNGRYLNVIDVDPVPGKDIVTTIDINIQDITEKALFDMLRQTDAESGTAVVMEVETGEVKGITNLGRVSEGRWGETKNFAVSDISEPGSTFKVASMIVALEDGVVLPSDTFDTGNGLYPYAGAIVRDHNAHHGGYGRISAAQAIWFSSNVGIAKMILRGYENNPTKYVEGLYKLGIADDLEIEIPGAGRSRIRKPTKENWSKTALPWMSFGYETQIPPIYTLSLFNAIANDGKMIKPVFVKEIQENGKTVEKKKTKVIRSSICSDKTLKEIRQMLLDVVENGTGTAVKSNFLPIAGKTGTAQLSQGAAGYTAGGKSHQVSFCGYFPADKPMYSVIVVIRKPRIGYPSGGTMAGGVCKVIAEEVYAKSIKLTPKDCPKDSLAMCLPKVKNGHAPETTYVLDKLDFPYKDKEVDTDWFAADITEKTIVMKDRSLIDNLVPNVMGMGAKDAVYLLENAGLRVNLTGSGAVVSQSITPGSRVVKGQTVAITLK